MSSQTLTLPSSRYHDSSGHPIIFNYRCATVGQEDRLDSSNMRYAGPSSSHHIFPSLRYQCLPFDTRVSGLREPSLHQV
ncbi:uncharacterized protein H6S33_006303 [Morchella sextelata]|uniref:uncharacterized protein n=1 Tax=Morchella sextelata TaxID=1174677 RepID=UPI001D059F36|nr:uncharacterized protein H6S33_006303 [Morchella sextelata]KAH0604635.1 hypothetical protein H6S33_006303 [Morchella sextelata]